jgi:hypothetical protein
MYWSCSGFEKVASSCECGNQPSGSIKSQEYRATTQLVASEVALSSIQLVIMKIVEPEFMEHAFIKCSLASLKVAVFCPT